MKKIKEQVNKYLKKIGCRPADDHQFVGFDNKTTPPSPAQVEQLFKAVEWILIRLHGHPYENAAFKVANKQLEEKKAQMKKEREAQLAKIMEKEKAEITLKYQAQNDEAMRMIAATEEKLNQLGAEREEERLEAMQHVEALRMEMEENKRSAEEAVKKAADEAEAKYQGEMNERIRQMETQMSQNAMQNQAAIAALTAQIERMNESSGCFPASAVVMTPTGDKTMDHLEVNQFLTNKWVILAERYENFQINDLVYTLDESGTGVQLTTFIGHMEVYPEQQMDFLHISFTDGNRIVLTGTHKVFVRRSVRFEENGTACIIQSNMLLISVAT